MYLEFLKVQNLQIKKRAVKQQAPTQDRPARRTRKTSQYIDTRADETQVLTIRKDGTREVKQNLTHKETSNLNRK